MLATDYKFGEVHVLADQIQAAADRVHFHRIFETSNGAVALIAFTAGQKLDEHLAPAEIMVTVLEGEIEFSVGTTPHHLNAGEFLLLGEGVAHSIAAKTDAKVMLTKIKA